MRNAALSKAAATRPDGRKQRCCGRFDEPRFCCRLWLASVGFDISVNGTQAFFHFLQAASHFAQQTNHDPHTLHQSNPYINRPQRPGNVCVFTFCPPGDGFRKPQPKPFRFNKVLSTSSSSSWREKMATEG